MLSTEAGPVACRDIGHRPHACRAPRTVICSSPAYVSVRRARAAAGCAVRWRPSFWHAVARLHWKSGLWAHCLAYSRPWYLPLDPWEKASAWGLCWGKMRPVVILASQWPLCIPGADATDEPLGTHPEAAAKGLPGREGSPVTRRGPCQSPTAHPAWKDSPAPLSLQEAESRGTWIPDI